MAHPGLDSDRCDPGSGGLLLVRAIARCHDPERVHLPLLCWRSAACRRCARPWRGPGQASGTTILIYCEVIPFPPGSADRSDHQQHDDCLTGSPSCISPAGCGGAMHPFGYTVLGYPRRWPGAANGWHTVTPRLFTDNVAGLVGFLKSVFAAAGELRSAAPTEMRIGDSILMISDGGGVRLAMPAVENADQTYERAIGAGVESIEKPADMPYGDRRATVRDPWTNIWQIATYRSRAHRDRRM